MKRSQRIHGCLFGMALGDAFGAPTEFLSVDQIREKWPPQGPREPYGIQTVGAYELDGLIRVTDDTQMGLAVGRALMSAIPSGLTPQSLTPKLRTSFTAWYRSPDNNRAPGRTCLCSCERLQQPIPWFEATDPSSKGCGANMRVQAVGLLRVGHHIPDQKTRAAIAQLQSALTHGHPTALVASELTAFVIADLLDGNAPSGLLSRLKAYVATQQEIYHEGWLGPLWQQPGISSAQQFIRRGWEECHLVIERLERALATPDKDCDPCLLTGAGWIAEESFATGLLCFLYFPEEPIAALQRAALSSGDSDSIACITGAFAGAYCGQEAWPVEWRERIEYQEELQSLGDFLSKATA